MVKKIHNAWGVLAAIWLTIAPSQAQATHTFQQQAVSLHRKATTRRGRAQRAARTPTPSAKVTPWPGSPGAAA